MFGALLTIAALGVGAAVLLEARAVTTVSAEFEHGGVTIAAPSLAGAPAAGTASLSNDARTKLQADLILDASINGAPGEISVRRIGGTGVAILRLTKKTIGKKGLAKARALVRRAGEDADLVVVILEAKSQQESTDTGLKGAANYARLTHAVIDSGADLVVARGPSEVKGLEWYRGRLIAYELGDGTHDGGDETSAAGGVAGALRVTLSPAGSWIDGRVLSLDGDGVAAPEAETVDSAFKLLRAQSRAHFGTNAVRVERSGSLRPPASEHA